MLVTESIPIPHGSVSGTHDAESGIGRFNNCRIVLKIHTVPTDSTGIFLLNGIKKFHELMRCDGRPVMSEYNNRQNISQNNIYDNADGECDEGFDTRVGQFTESRRKANT